MRGPSFGLVEATCKPIFFLSVPLKKPAVGVAGAQKLAGFACTAAALPESSLLVKRASGCDGQAAVDRHASAGLGVE